MRKQLYILFSLLLIAVVVLPPISVFASEGTKTIQAKALDDHECDDEEWHFVITQVDGESLAPASILVKWANGSSKVVSLWKFTGHTAHYRTTANLDSSVDSATAQIYSGWEGQFNLSHGPCDGPRPTPTPPPPHKCVIECDPYFVEEVFTVQQQYHSANECCDTDGGWRVIVRDIEGVVLCSVDLIDNDTNTVLPEDMGDCIKPDFINEDEIFGSSYYVFNQPADWSHGYRITAPDGSPLWEYLQDLGLDQDETRITCSAWPEWGFTSECAYYPWGGVPSDMAQLAREAWGLSYIDALIWSESLIVGECNPRP